MAEQTTLPVLDMSTSIPLTAEPEQDKSLPKLDTSTSQALPDLNMATSQALPVNGKIAPPELQTTPEVPVAPAGKMIIGPRMDEQARQASRTWIDRKLGIPSAEEAVNWLQDLQGDIAHGTATTKFGAVLRYLGHTAEPENQRGVVPDPISGFSGITEGALTFPKSPVIGLNIAAKGAMTTVGLGGLVAQPEVLPAMLVGAATQKTVSTVLKAAGASPDVQELGGNIGALVAMGKVSATSHSVDTFARNMESHLSAQEILQSRTREVGIATEQVKAAADAAEAARVAASDGTGTKKAADDAQTNLSEATANSKKAQKALQEATEMHASTGAALAKAGRQVTRQGSPPKKDIKAAAAAKEDWFKAFPNSAGANVSPADYEIIRAHLEAQHAKNPVMKTEETHAALQNAVDGIDANVKAAIEPNKDQLLNGTVKADVVDALKDHQREDFLEKGLQSLAEYPSLENPTLEDSVKLITQFNHELRDNVGFGSKHRNWAAAMATDPEFAAKSIAVDSLRHNLFDRLTDLGVENVEPARQEQAALIRGKDAVERQLFKGGAKIRGSGETGKIRKAVGKSAMAVGTLAGAGAGAYAGGWLGAEVGAGIGGWTGKKVGEIISPIDITRDAAVERMNFGNKLAGVSPVEITDTGTPTAPPSMPRDFTPLHGELQSYYGPKAVGKSYNELAQWLTEDYSDKQRYGAKIEPSEQTLYGKIVQEQMADMFSAREAAQKAATEGKQEIPKPNLPENAVPVQQPARNTLPNHMTMEEGMTHDITHHVMADEVLGNKLPAIDIRSNSHSDNSGTGAVMTAAFDWSNYHDAEGNIDPEKVFKDIDAIATVFVSGGVANDLWHDVPFTENRGVNGDLRELRRLMTDADISPFDQSRIIATAADRAVEFLERPGIRDTIEGHANVREPGLDKKFHVSKERTQQILQDVREVNDANGTRKYTPGSERTEGGNEERGARGEKEVAGEPKEAVAKAVGGKPEGPAKDEGRGNKEAPAKGYVPEGGSVISEQELAEAAKKRSPNPALEREVKPFDIEWLPNGKYAVKNPKGIELGRYTTRGEADVAASQMAKQSASRNPNPALEEESDMERARRGARAAPKPLAEFVTERRATEAAESEARRGAWEKAQRANNGELAGPIERRANPNPALTAAQMPPERTTQNLEHDRAIREGGGVPGGLLGTRQEGVSMFHVPETGTTLGHPANQELTPQIVKDKITESRRQYKVGDAVNTAAKTEGARFTFHPRTGETPKDGYMVETHLDRGKNFDHPPTADDIHKYIANNQDLISKEPDLHVGGYKNSLGLSERFEDRGAAEKAGKDRNQISIYDLKKGEEIPTGGTGKGNVEDARQQIVDSLHQSTNAQVRPIQYRSDVPFSNGSGPSMIYPDGTITAARVAHRDISNAAGFGDDVRKFQQATGGIRVMYPGEGGNIGIEMHRPPTEEQMRITADTIKRANAAGVEDNTLTWDLGVGSGYKTGYGSVGDFHRAVDAWKSRNNPNPALTAEHPNWEKMSPEGDTSFNFGANRPVETTDRISTRVTGGKDATENHMVGEPLTINRAALEAAPEKLQDKFSKKVREVPGVKIPKNITDNGKIYNRFTDHVADNLKAIWNRVDPVKRAANAKWYESANKLAGDVANQHGYTKPQVAGTIAAMSPQMDWDANVSLAKRIVDIHKNHLDKPVTPEMIQKGKDIIAASRKGKAKGSNAALETMLPIISGKTIGDPTLTPLQRAGALRLYDEVNNPRQFPRIDPGTGNEMEMRTNVDGSTADVGWGSLNNIAKALSILDDGSRENISANVGASHKVRNFYNNIIDPTNGTDVTIDTHAVGAASMLPLSGNSKMVTDNFGGGGKNKATGVVGTYPLWAEGYRKAAADLGVKPRELQSVTWEKIREMFPAEWKTKENLERVKAEWKKHTDGKQTADQTRENIFDMADQAQTEVAQIRATARAKAEGKAKAPGKMNALDFINAMKQNKNAAGANALQGNLEAPMGE